jgi:hypothetical protein
MDKIAVRVCACGCGAKVKSKWVRGHHSRINNISKRKDIREKRARRFKQMHVDGVLQPWNRGLTGSDPRVASNIIGLSKEARSKVGRKTRSVRMKKQRLDGTIPTLTGPNHSQWNGGTSGISLRIRGSTQLYKLWKRPILERDGFTCTKCLAGERLVVHHSVERFADIVKMFIFRMFPDAQEKEISFDDGTKVIDAIIKYHVEKPVSGITICEDCHILSHKGE